jgi:hypothetical protein
MALFLASALLLAGSSCAERERAPATLVDGSRARQPPVELEGVSGPAVLTATRALRRAGMDARVESCADQGWSERPSGPAALRIGVDGVSVTLGGGARGGVYACDGSPGRDAGTTWCGVAFGRRVDGRLLDPRLDLGGCFSAHARPVAFAWIEPERGARYVVVRHSRFAEVFEVAAELPVRATTTERVDLERSRATFAVSEHSASGALVRRYVLAAHAAG